MTPRVPTFVRRLWRLLEARRALVEGAPEDALAALRDPALALSSQADALRRRALEAVYRRAAHRASEGRDASVARLLTAVAAEDPVRADEWRRHLAPPPEGAPGHDPGLRAELARMRSEAPPPEESDRTRAAGSSPGRATPPPGAPLRFHLAVDDGGEHLVLCGSSITIGHARSGAADVPLLADLESVHARLTFGQSFHGGPTWHVEPVGRGTVSVDGRRAEDRLELFDGAEVRLAPQLAFRFERPDPASASARVELLRGVEAAGATRLLLFVPGRAGRVRIGPRTSRHLPVAGIEHEVELVLRPEDAPRELVLRCEGGVRLLPAPGEPRSELALPCPPDRRVDVLLGARPARPEPFGLSIAPVQGSGGTPTIEGTV